MRIFYTDVKDGDDRSRLVRQLLDWAWRREFGGVMPTVLKTEKGKPYFDARPDVHFSLSHTDSHVLCAIGLAPVGADVQTHRQVSDRVQEYTTGERERTLFDFFELWCLKESYIKLKGRYTGLLRETVFDLQDGCIIAPEEGISCRVYHNIPGCTAAVCYMGDGDAELVYVNREML